MHVVKIRPFCSTSEGICSRLSDTLRVTSLTKQILIQAVNSRLRRHRPFREDFNIQGEATSERLPLLSSCSICHPHSRCQLKAVSGCRESIAASIMQRKLPFVPQVDKVFTSHDPYICSPWRPLMDNSNAPFCCGRSAFFLGNIDFVPKRQCWKSTFQEVGRKSKGERKNSVFHSRKW